MQLESLKTFKKEIEHAHIKMSFLWEGNKDDKIIVFWNSCSSSFQGQTVIYAKWTVTYWIPFSSIAFSLSKVRRNRLVTNCFDLVSVCSCMFCENLTSRIVQFSISKLTYIFTLNSGLYLLNHVKLLW